MRVGKNKGGKKKEKFDMAACARFLDVFINKTYKVVKIGVTNGGHGTLSACFSKKYMKD